MEKLKYLNYIATIKFGKKEKFIKAQFYIKVGKPIYSKLWKDGMATFFGKEIKINKSKIINEIYYSPKSGKDVAYDEEEAIKYLERKNKNKAL